MNDAILAQLHDTREKLLAEAGGTVEGLAAALRQRQRESGRRILNSEATQISADPASATKQSPAKAD